MFLDDQRSEKKPTDLPVRVFSSTLRKNVIDQAASMLMQHVTFHRHVYPVARNSNGNALDEHRHSLNDVQRKKRDVRRTSKCNSWLSKAPTKSDSSLDRGRLHTYWPPVHPAPTEHLGSSITPSVYAPPRIHPNQLTLSTNATTDITPDLHPQTEPFGRPLIMVHKKRLRRDSFLSTMQNCIQPPYSRNHFYALDQANMLKLQRNLHSHPPEKHSPDDDRYKHFKRKYPEDDDHEVDRTSPFEHSSPQTADHISMHKYHQEPASSAPFEVQSDRDQSISKQKSEESHVILSRLEKILDLCGELRSIAKDVELHLNEHSMSKTASTELNEKGRGKDLDSEETIIDIYKELDHQPTTVDYPEQTAPPPCPTSNDIASIQSESTKSVPLMQTESFKTKSPSLTTSQTKLRKSEDICSCFLKSLLQQENCDLTAEEQEYLNELTKAYILGREQVLREQQEASGKFQAFANETVPEKSDERLPKLYDTNNNNRSIDRSSVSSHTDLRKPDDTCSVIQPRTMTSTMAVIRDDQQPLGMISLKHQSFLLEPIAMKTTGVLPGIGRKYAEQLDECGFSTVRRLLGFYLMIKDDQHFVIWLNNKAGIAIHSARLCAHALRAWCQTHLSTLSVSNADLTN